MGGLFKKKRKTETSSSTAEDTINKIVKLSYIQSLALSGGVITAKSLVETSSNSTTSNLGDSSARNAIGLLNEKFGSTTTAAIGNNIGSLLGGSLGTTLGSLLTPLFGKKVERSGTLKIEDSGWSLVKTWNQPEFDIIRYAIGIRDLSVASFVYTTISEVVSKSWVSPKEIIKVTLLIDQFIPPNFPPGNYIEYYIKPDIENTDWVRINSMNSPTQYQEDGTIVPRIITFNSEKPVSARIEESYLTTKEPVKSIRFRAIIKRPDNLDSYSPILKSYRLKFNLRNGL